MKKFLAFLIIALMIPSVLAFGTLSLSRIDFNSNDPDLRGPTFLLLGVENQRADTAQYSFSQLESESGVKSQKSGTITTYLQDYKVRYPVRSGQTISDASVIAKYFTYIWFGESHYAQLCADDGGDIYYKERGGFYYHCVKFNDVATTGIIESGISDWDLRIDVSSSGESHSVHLTPNAKQDSYSDLMIARLEGTLGGFAGDKPVLGTDYATAFHYSRGHYLIDKNRANTFLSYHDSGFNTCIANAVSSLTNPEVCLDEYNRLSDLATSQATYTQYQIGVSGTTTEGQVVLTNTPIFDYPAFTLKISAEWVGIFLPVGKPNIISLTPYDFSEGGSGYIEARIRNDASVEASFDIQTTCPQPFDALPIGIKRFSPYAEGTVNIPITGETQAQDCGTCKVKVVDSSNPTIFDEKSVEICVAEAVQCGDAGEVRCVDSKIEICTSKEGVKVWRTTEVCEGVCEYVDGVPICAEGPPPAPTCQEECASKYVSIDPRSWICNAGCKTVPLLSRFAILLAGIASFFAFLFGTKFGREIGGLERNGSLIAGGVFALIIFIVTYLYWVWAVVAMIILAIAMYFIGGFTKFIPGGK